MRRVDRISTSWDRWGRIVILTDTDGDGEVDERKIFKDKIMFPTGIALGHGGVFVGSPPNLLFIPDKDRDDVPDGEPEILLDGWGRQDRHETLNSFLWGPDGWLYGCHGVFTHSKVGKPGTPDKDRKPINAGVWRYDPVGKEFEVFAWGTSNPWGLDFKRTRAGLRDRVRDSASLSHHPRVGATIGRPGNTSTSTCTKTSRPSPVTGTRQRTAGHDSISQTSFPRSSAASSSCATFTGTE